MIKFLLIIIWGEQWEWKYMKKYVVENISILVLRYIIVTDKPMILINRCINKSDNEW